MENARIISEIPLAYYLADFLNPDSIEFMSDDLCALSGFGENDFFNEGQIDFSVMIDNESLEYIKNSRFSLTEKEPEKTIYYSIKHKSGKSINIQENLKLVDVSGSKKIMGLLLVNNNAIISDNKWYHMIKNAPYYVSLVNKGLLIEYTNHNLNDIPKEILRGMPVTDLFEERYRVMIKETIEHVFETGEYATYELHVPNENGDITWLYSRVGPLKMGNEISNVMIYTYDVTKRKLMEEALRQSEARFRAITEYTTDVTVILGSDKNLKYVTPSIKKITGYSVTELLHTSPITYIHPEDSEQYIWTLTKAFETQNQSFYISNVRVKHKQGHWIICEGLITSMVEVQGVEGTVINFRDITDRRKTENELEAARQRLLAAQNIAKVGSWEIDLVENKILWSDEMYNIYKRPKELGPIFHEWKEYVQPDYLSMVRSKLEKVYKGEGTGDMEVGIRCADGEEKIMLVRAGINKDFKGYPIKIIGTSLDITERKKEEERRLQLEEKLFQAQRLETIGTLAGGIAHDFKNILSSMVGFANLAKQNLDEDSSAKHDLDNLLSVSEHANELINQILFFSHNENINKTKVNIEHLINEVLMVIQTLMKKEVNINKVYNHKTNVIRADRAQLFQVILNLLKNGIQALEDTGDQITIFLEHHRPTSNELLANSKLKNQDYLQIKIQDNGVGIDKLSLKRIFDPFYSTKSYGKGTGLGLSITHSIIMKHNGDIKVYSEPGKGTAFSILLPLDNNEHPSNGFKVVYIDDNPIAVPVINKILRSNGYQVVNSNSISVDEVDIFDAVIMDNICDITGEKDKVKDIPEEIPVVILCEGKLHQKESKRKNTYFLKKPVEPDQIINLLSDIIPSNENKEA